MSNFSVEFKSISEMLERRGLEAGGRVQRVIDNAVIKYSEPLVPMDTGTLEGSAKAHTVIGSGIVRYVTPYAHFQYVKNKSTSGRGRKWFERMKEKSKGEILEEAQRAAGGESE